MQERPEEIGPSRAGIGNPVVRILLIALCVLLAVMVAANIFTGDGAANSAVGTQLNEMEYFPLTNSSQPIGTAETRGRVVLLNFWGPWCPPCLAEMPEINRLQKELADEPDFLFISVSCRNSEISLERMKEQTEMYLQSQDFTFATYHDYSWRSRTHLVKQAKLNGFGYPTNVALDRQGKIIGFWPGYSAEVIGEIEQLIRAELARGE